MGVRDFWLNSLVKILVLKSRNNKRFKQTRYFFRENKPKGWLIGMWESGVDSFLLLTLDLTK